MQNRRLIDANAIREKAVPHTRGEYGWNAEIRKWAVLVGDIDDAPTVDAVEVVRCKNCKHLYDGLDNYCCMLHKGLVLISENSFCSYGERKGNG